MGQCCDSIKQPLTPDDAATATSCPAVREPKDCAKSVGKADRQVLCSLPVCDTASQGKGHCGSFIPRNHELESTGQPASKVKGCCGSSKLNDEVVAPAIVSRARPGGCCSSRKPTSQDISSTTTSKAETKGCCGSTKLADRTVSKLTTTSSMIPKSGCCDDDDTPAFALSIDPAPLLAMEQDSKSGPLLDKDDDEICPCCIKPAIKAFVSGQTMQKMNELADRGSKAIRRCCRIFHGNDCARMACCLPPLRNRQRSSSGGLGAGRTASLQTPSYERNEGSLDKAHELSSNSPLKPMTKPQRSIFRLDGMDCASCSIKVVRAASKLESARSIQVDYFASRLGLDHDPDRMDASTIASFVSRATGFKVVPLLEPDDSTSSRMSLPIKTEIPFCQDDTDKYTVVNKKGYHQLTFDPKIHPPRTVLKDLERFGATLIPREQADDRRTLARRAYHVSLVRSIACVVLVIPTLVMTWGSPDLSFAIRHGIAMAFSSVVALLSSSLLLGSVKSLAYLRHADIQLLVAVSTTAAYIFSVVAFGLGLADIDFEEPFFETPALLLTLVHIGGSVQAYARQTVMQAAASMQTMQPDEALLLHSDSPTPDTSKHQWQLVDTRLLHYGDVIRVETDCVIAADGILIDNDGTIDESCMTGESLPVVKGVGSVVVAGCINVGAPLQIHVSRLVHENTAAKMAELVNRAHQTRMPVQDAADRIAAVILPATLVAAAISLLVWSLVSRFGQDRAPADAGILGLTYAIAVVAVACPCALVLVSPMVVAMVVNVGLSGGIIFKSTAALWSFHNMDVFAFDKTGTLTEGKMRVLEASLLDEQASPLIATLVANQTHPISKAISAHVGCAPEVLTHMTQRFPDPVVHPGKGLQSAFAGFALLGGSAEYTQAEFEPDLKGDVSSSAFYVTLGGLTVARFALQDMERSDAKDLVRKLQAAGKRVVVISGDLPGPVERLAASIGLAPSDANSRCSPSAKLDIIRDLQASGARVCYVGDGANDAAALAAANVSIAIDGGADLAQATADITIASDRRLKDSIMASLALARLARWHIKVGFAWSIVYNVFAVLLASGAFVRVRIAPRWAGLGELASLLPVFIIAFGTH